jgi:YhcH/YjgK/YiaL family protein
MALFGRPAVLIKQTAKDNLLKALEFIVQADINLLFDKVSPGNNQLVEIDGKKIYAIVQQYFTKPATEVKIEGHRKYIDIQLMVEGEEIIQLAGMDDITSEGIYNAEKDVHFPEVGSFSKLTLRAGDAAILFPEDLHGPCCCVEEPRMVKKVVFKVSVV